MKIKKLLNKFGYDVKKYHPVFETTIKPLNIKTVLDIGANIGSTALEFRKLFPDAHIHSFEPLPSCFSKLVENMHGDNKFNAYNIALGETEGEMIMQESSFHPSSSLLPMTDLHKKLYPKSSGMTERKIRIAKLDKILSPDSLEKNIFIKIDVQGFEDHVIAGGQKVIQNARAIQIETSFVTLYEGQPLFNDIYQLLIKLGFSYYGDLGRHYSQISGKLIYEDSIFINKKQF